MSLRSALAPICLAGLLGLSACSSSNAKSTSPPALTWWLEDTEVQVIDTSVLAVDVEGNVVTATSHDTFVEVQRLDATNNTIFDVNLTHVGYARRLFAANDGSTYAVTDGYHTGERLLRLDASGKVVWSVIPLSGKAILTVRELSGGELGVVLDEAGHGSPHVTHLSVATGAPTVPLFVVPLPNAYAAAMRPDGTMVFAGPFSAPIAAAGLSPAGTSDFYVASTDANGQVLWALSEGGDPDVVLEGLNFLPDGTIIAGGEAMSRDGTFSDSNAFGADLNGDYPFVVAFSPQGSVKWVTRIDAPFGGIGATMLSVGPHAIFAGVHPETMGTDNSMVAMDFDGTPLWGMPVHMDVMSVAAAPNGTFYACGEVTGVLGGRVQGNHQGILAQWK